MSEHNFYRLEVKICVRRCCVCERRSCHEGHCWTRCSSQSAPERSEDAATVHYLDWFPFQGIGLIHYWNCKKEHKFQLNFHYLPGFLQICAPDHSCLCSLIPKRECHTALLLRGLTAVLQEVFKLEERYFCTKTAEESAIEFRVKGWNLIKQNRCFLYKWNSVNLWSSLLTHVGMWYGRPTAWYLWSLMHLKIEYRKKISSRWLWTRNNVKLRGLHFCLLWDAKTRIYLQQFHWKLELW